MLENTLVALERTMEDYGRIDLLIIASSFPLSERLEQVKQAIIKYPRLSSFYRRVGLFEKAEYSSVN